MTKDQKSILLVEDDEYLVDIYNTKLTQAGFKVEVADNGKTAMSLLQKALPDLVLLDIVMPEMNGWEFLRIAQKDKKLKNLKIIILSNLGQREEVAKGLGMGVVKYLIKAQFTPAEVVAKVKEVLK